MKRATVVVLGSHSALDVCRGAKDEGLRTLVVVQKGREKTYEKYYRTNGKLGCVDECLQVEKFADVLRPEIQKELLTENAIFVPHRSFEVYLNFDYEAIEKTFRVPIFGNKYLLKVEERGRKPNQYDLLDGAEIRYPKQFTNPRLIDRLCLVKILEKERGFERAFFLAGNFKEFKEKIDEGLNKGTFSKEQVKRAVIEEFIIGVQVSFNFFYSPITQRLELLGTDTRRQTNYEGINRIPAEYQKEVLGKVAVKYEEAGHIAVTVLESMLEEVFLMGERFVTASQKMFAPGIIGPFALQAIITPGPPKKEIVVVDVSPRMPGSPGTMYTPYSYYLYGKNVSVGRRVAMEVKKAVETNDLKKILT